MSADFEDIDIVDLDVARTTHSRVHASMRTMYLRLDREPDVAWVRHFFEERSTRINPRRHGLWIEDGFIVVDCFVDDLETHHLPDIRRSISHANAKAREGIDRHREASERSREATEDEHDALAALRERIRKIDAPAVTPAPESETAAAPDDAGLAETRSAWQREFRAALAAKESKP